MDLYKWAAKNAVRVNYHGQLSAEDLFNLPADELDDNLQRKDPNRFVPNLKDLGLKLEEKISKRTESSFFSNAKTSEDTYQENVLALIKDIYTTKIGERQARMNKGKISKERQELLAIMAEQQNAALRSNPELVAKRLAELEALEKGE